LHFHQTTVPFVEANCCWRVSLCNTQARTVMKALLRLAAVWDT